MTAISLHDGTLYTDKKLAMIPEPDPQTREEYDLMRLRRILHECEHDRDAELTKQLDAVEALVSVLPADRDSADIVKAARKAGFRRAQMVDPEGTNDTLKGSLTDAGYSLDGRF